MNDTDLKPGDIVQHPMWGNGVVAYTKFGLRVIGTSDGYECIFGLTGWERVETIRPGHVQVRVDDLDLSRWEGAVEKEWYNATRVAIRAANAIAAQRAESTPPADEKPMSATVTLYCPDCGEAENVTVVMLGRQSNGERWFDLREFHAHTCPPAQPDEPGLGAVVTVDGTHYVRIERDAECEPFHWLKVGSPGTTCTTWAELTERGTVTLGWAE